MISDMLKVSAVYDLSAVHNKDAVCYFGDGSQVMGDEKHGSIFILFNADKLFQDLVLSDGINGSCWFISNEKFRLQCHGNTDHNTLEHTAGELMRIFFQNFFSI